MNMIRERVRTDELTAGDIIRKAYVQRTDGKTEAKTRTLVVSDWELGELYYHGQLHQVAYVTALDTEKNRRVMWAAIPDQRVTVIR